MLKMELSLSTQLREHFDSTSKEDLEDEWNNLPSVIRAKIHETQVERAYQNILKNPDNIQKVADTYNGYRNDLLYLIGAVASKYGVEFNILANKGTDSSFYHLLGYNFYWNYDELYIEKGHKPTNFDDVIFALKVLKDFNNTNLAELIENYSKYSNQKINMDDVIQMKKDCGIDNIHLFHIKNKYFKTLKELKNEN